MAVLTTDHGRSHFSWRLERQSAFYEWINVIIPLSLSCFTICPSTSLLNASDNARMQSFFPPFPVFFVDLVYAALVLAWKGDCSVLTQFANGIQLTSANEVAIKYLECLAFALETINNSYNLGCSIWTGRNVDEQFIQQG